MTAFFGWAIIVFVVVTTLMWFMVPFHIATIRKNSDASAKVIQSIADRLATLENNKPSGVGVTPEG